MEKLLSRKEQWKHLLMFFVCLISMNKAQAQSYDFKAENDEGITIYYVINGDNVTVTFGDQKYNGIIRIPSIVNYDGNTYNVTSIGKNAFYYCQSLESIELPASITTIDEYAFYECGSLKSASIPANVRFIGDNAFSYCKSLESIDFPENLETIGQYVFNGCGKLASVSIPANVTSIGKAAFAYTASLSSITVDGKNEVYDSRQNCNAIIETLTNTLMTGCKTTKIPDGVKVIGKNAFYYCQSLESIELPASITTIDEYAFYECGNLKSATIPANVRSIGDNAYGYCKAIEYVESQVEVPFEVGDNVFYQETKKTATLYVPKGSKFTYQSTKGWEFENIVEKDKDDNNNGDNDSEISLVVWAKDGSKVAFALSKKPKITFSEADLQITGQDIDVSYALDNMVRFTYEIVNDETAIKDIQTEKVNFKLTGESLLFPELKANSTVSIYSLNGTLVFSKIIRVAGEYSFPLSDLNVGVYLVSVNGLTYKIVKR